MREEIYQIRRPEHILFGDPLYLDNKKRFKNVLIDYQPEKCFDVRLVLKEEPDPQDARFILKYMDLYFAPPQDLKIYMNNRIYQGQQSKSKGVAVDTARYHIEVDERELDIRTGARRMVGMFYRVLPYGWKTEDFRCGIPQYLCARRGRFFMDETKCPLSFRRITANQ